MVQMGQQRLVTRLSETKLPNRLRGLLHAAQAVKTVEGTDTIVGKLKIDMVTRRREMPIRTYTRCSIIKDEDDRCFKNSVNN